jgi:Rrf2 family protein
VKLTTRSEYALLALIFLARRHGQGTATVAEIAASEGIPAGFLQQIFMTLKTAHIVHSAKGRHGGFALARHPQDITLAEIIRLLDGPLAPTESTSENFYAHTPIERAPGLLALLRDIRDYVAQRMEGTTLADVSKM